MTDAYPAALHLPQGIAYLVPGMAVYLLDGRPVDVEVEIPDDLRRAGWYWHGSCLTIELAHRYWYGIPTCHHPPPGVPSSRDNCFDAARKSDLAYLRTIGKAKKSKPKRATKAVQSKQAAARRLQQEVMELL